MIKNSLSSSKKTQLARNGLIPKPSNDYNASVSYQKYTGRYFTLKGVSYLTIEGIVTAKLSINGTVPLICKTLHISALLNPLYLLRKHKYMSGCGISSHYGVDSYVLFCSPCSCSLLTTVLII